MVAVLVNCNDQRQKNSPETGTRRLCLWQRLLVSIVLIGAGLTSVAYNWPLRAIKHGQFTFSANEALREHKYPLAQYAYGLNAWQALQNEQASMHFRQAVQQDPLFVDAWLRLAQSEAALGKKARAQAIASFTADMIGPVSYRKWQQLVLLKELQMPALLKRTANDLLYLKVLTQDTLQLLHAHFKADTQAVLSVLEPPYQEQYLDWLMRWQMTDESLQVWESMSAQTLPEAAVALRLVDFLLGQKRVEPSAAIWRKYTGYEDLTNPGFEAALTGRGFDWRSENKTDHWTIQRVREPVQQAQHSLQIVFNGQQNILFHHLAQIFPATPATHYRLVYSWKSHEITTDQGPFVEIFGFDGQGLYAAGPAITGTHDWHEVSIAFRMPETCRAAIVRLHRKPSNRFDSKIRGSLWIDDFRLEKDDPVLSEDHEDHGQDGAQSLLQDRDDPTRHFTTR
jgi:hypothetical protein